MYNSVEPIYLVERGIRLSFANEVDGEEERSDSLEVFRKDVVVARINQFSR